MNHKIDILKFGTPFAEHLVYGNWVNLFKNTAYTYQLLYLKFEDIWIYGIAFLLSVDIDMIWMGIHNVRTLKWVSFYIWNECIHCSVSM
jgi:hypothetical protein